MKTPVFQDRKNAVGQLPAAGSEVQMFFLLRQPINGTVLAERESVSSTWEGHPMKWSVLMVAALARVLGGALRSRLVVASFLLVGNMLLWPSGAIAEIITGPLKASQFYGDDVNTVVAPALKAIT